MRRLCVRVYVLWAVTAVVPVNVKSAIGKVRFVKSHVDRFQKGDHRLGDTGREF